MSTPHLGPGGLLQKREATVLRTISQFHFAVFLRLFLLICGQKDLQKKGPSKVFMSVACEFYVAFVGGATGLLFWKGE